MQGARTKTDLAPRGLRVYRNGRHARSRQWTQLTGLALPNTLGVYDACVDNGERAFAERYYYCKVGVEFLPALTPLKGAFVERELAEFREAVCGARFDPPATRREVVGAYSGLKRLRYELADASLAETDLCSNDARLSAFVKFEKQAMDKAPRIINPRTPRFNLELGRYIKFNEHKFFNAINDAFNARFRTKGITVFKGMDMTAMARDLRTKWDDFHAPVAIGVDAVKFDMHVSRDALKYEAGFYTHALFGRDVDFNVTNPGVSGSYERLCWLMLKEQVNSGRAKFPDGRIKFQMKGTRASGDLNTSLGNVILMCSLIWAWAVRRGLRVSLANNGDDCVIIMEADDLEAFTDGFEDYYANHGFRLTIEPPAYCFERIEFCQTQPVLVDDQWRMLRNPNVTVQKGSMCTLPIPNTRVLRRWMMSVGLCEGSLNEGVPVLQHWAAAMRRNGLKASRKFQENVWRGTTRGYYYVGRDVQPKQISTTTRVSFFKAFGITPDEQTALEQKYQQYTLGDNFVEESHSDRALDKLGIERDMSTILLAGHSFNIGIKTC